MIRKVIKFTILIVLRSWDTISSGNDNHKPEVYCLYNLKFLIIIFLLRVSNV